MKTEYDVVVLGWGVAWVSAALSARREWKSVVILEKNSLLGWLATCWLIHRYEPLCDGRWKQVIYSQAEELLKLSIKYWYKTLDENWLKWKKWKWRYATYFDPNLFALSLTKLVDNEGIEIFFESQIAEFKHKNWKVLAVDIYTIEWKIRIKGKVFIDATRSGYAGKMLWIPFKNWSNYLTYVTTTYKKWLQNPVLQRSGANLHWDNHPKWMRKFKQASQDDVNEYLVAGQKLALEEFEKWIKQDLSILPNMVQFRKISMLKGEYILLWKDKCRHFKDSIWAVWIFNEEGTRYERPLHRHQMRAGGLHPRQRRTPADPHYPVHHLQV